MDEDAVVGDLLFKDINSALYHFAVAVCTYHIANGAYRHNEGADGDDHGQHHPKDVDESLLFSNLCHTALRNMHKLMCLYRDVPYGILLHPLYEFGNDIFVDTPLWLNIE